MCDKYQQMGQLEKVIDDLRGQLEQLIYRIRRNPAYLKKENGELSPTEISYINGECTSSIDERAFSIDVIKLAHLVDKAKHVKKTIDKLENDKVALYHSPPVNLSDKKNLGGM